MNDNNANSSSFTRTLITAALAVVPLLTCNVAADWPTDPASPLIVGHAEGLFGPRITTAAADDHAIWVTWQDSFCQGALRIQRLSLTGDLLAPIGIEIQDDPTCGFTLPPILSTNNNGAVVTRSLSGLADYPLHNVNPEGSSNWETSFSPQTPTGLWIAATTQLESNDTLVVSALWTTVRADRLDESGNQVWSEPCEFENTTSPNFRIFSVVPEPTGGAYIFYDSFHSYTKALFCMRITDQGQPAWESPVVLTDFFAGFTSSRHSDPIAVSDHAGGAMIVWAHGFETALSPAPLRIQQIHPDGSLEFSIEGKRVSLDDERQFHPKVQTDGITGDLLITWRDGLGLDMTLNAQRFTISGERLWGDSGITIAPLDPTTSNFNILWHNNRLSVAIADPNGSRIHNTDGSGNQTPSPWVLSVAGPAADIQISKSADGIIAVWQADGPGNSDLIVAQRINPDGSLGNPPCQADLNADGDLNFFDVSAFLSDFADQDQTADFNADGEFNFFDVSSFLAAFAVGCP